jgi:hypothetical protein
MADKGLVVALRPSTQAFRDAGCHQADGPDGVVVARNQVIDVVGSLLVSTTATKGYAQLAGFMHGDLFTARVDTKIAPGRRSMSFDPAHFSPASRSGVP